MECPNCSTRFDKAARTPHILPCCGHSLCALCIQGLSTEQILHCPICMRQSNSRGFPINQALLSLATSLLCEVHYKPIEAFCSNENQLLCVKCVLEGHRGHSVSSVEKAVAAQKEYYNSIQKDIQKVYTELVGAKKTLKESVEGTRQSYERAMSEIEAAYQTVRDRVQQRECIMKEKLRKLLETQVADFREVAHANKRHLRAVDTVQHELKKVAKEEAQEVLMKAPERDELIGSLLTQVRAVPQNEPFAKYTLDKELNALRRLVNETGCKSPTESPNPVPEFSQRAMTPTSLISKTAHQVKTPQYPYNPDRKSSTKAQTIKIQGLNKSQWNPPKRTCSNSASSFPPLDLDSLCVAPSQLIYNISGFSESGIEAYDVSQDHWVTVCASAPPRIQFGAVPFQEKILLFGGKQEGLKVASSEIYCRSSHEWLPSAFSLPAPLSGFGYALVRGSIVLAGGSANSPVSSVEKFEGNRWCSLPTMQERRDELGLALGADLNLYAVGGYTGEGRSLASAERLDLRTGSWEQLQGLGVPRRALALCSFPDGLYAVGGFDGRHFLASMEKFDLRMCRWVELPQMRHARCTLSAVSTPDCLSLYSIGGFNDEGLAVVEKYSVAGNLWTEVSPLNSPRFMHCSLVFLDK